MKSFGALLAVCLVPLGLVACSGDDDDTAEPAATEAAAAATEAPAAAADGVRVVSPEEAAAIVEDQPEGLVILDVRTDEEFDAGHLDGAMQLDFYRDDFADELAQLDADVPYVLYCQSGNRSSQARAMMADLGFTSVADIDGGFAAWQAAGLDVVTS